MNNIKGWWAVSVVYALALGGSIFANAVWAAVPGASCPADQERLQIAYRKLPLHFEVNQGQAEGTVKFLAQGRGYSLSLTPSEAVLNLHKPLSESPRQAGTSAVIPPPTAVVRMQLVGSSPAPEIAGEQPLPGKSHYLIGRDPGKWRTNIPHYARVRYRSVYPGIDLVYHGQQEQLEYDFVVAPGADPKQIRLDIQGAEKLYLDAAGNLVVRVAGGELIQQVPKVYQQVGDKRQAIPGRYVLANNQIGFEVGTYEATRPLVIDPVMCTSPGEGESSRGIAVDPEGQVYMTGLVGGQVFVTKLAADRQTVMYHCIFSGSGTQESTAIAVDRQGRAYVTGSTNSTDFPISNALQEALAGGTDAFIMRLAADGQPEYSTYLGGGGSDIARSIAVRKGRAYVAGETDSTDFRMANPLQPGIGGGNDAFVAKLSKNGKRLVYSTYLGGGGSDIARGIAVRKDQAYVTGGTRSTNFPTEKPLQLGKGGGPAQLSDSTDFTTANPLQGTRGGRLGLSGGMDAFVTKLTKDGQDPVYSTYLGGSGNDRGQGIDVDPEGQIYLIGSTGSSEDFPTEKPEQKDFGGGERDAFVAKLTEDGQELVYSTYLGGPGNEKGQGLDVDSDRDVQSTVTTTMTAAAMDNINNAPDDPVTDADAMPVGSGGSGNGTLLVTLGDVAPNIAVKKNADPTLVPASGDSVTVNYKVMVTNNTTNSTEALMLTSLIDDKFGDLNGQGDCTVPQTLAVNGTYSCSFQQSLPAGEPATEHVNTVTAAAKNNAGIEDTATDDATVRFASRATLKVIKQVTNDNGGSAKAGDFTMYVNGNNPSPDSFPGEESPGTTVRLDAGDYKVTEGSVMGYTQDSPSAECEGSIAAGETRTCTITNNDNPPQAATLTVIKDVINDNGGTAAADAFTINVTGTNASPASFPGAASPGTTVTLEPGDYSVDEAEVSGYTKSLGTDCSGSIAAGETKTCTITNEDDQPPPEEPPPEQPPPEEPPPPPPEESPPPG